MKVRFGQIKRGQKFWRNGVLWERTRGRFATPVAKSRAAAAIGLGMRRYEWPVDLNEMVLPAA